MLFIAFSFTSAPAVAAVIGIAPFVGGWSETWESRSNYLTPFFHVESNPTLIMGGHATLGFPDNPFSSSDVMAVYQPSAGAGYIIGGIGARVSDGTKGLGIDVLGVPVSISFALSVSDFGAYWGTGTPSNGLSISFFGSNGQSLAPAEFFSYTRNGSFPGGDGVLEWHGWHSDEPIQRVDFSGSFVAIDGLQANPVPEPASLILVLGGIGILGMRGARRSPKRSTASPGASC